MCTSLPNLSVIAPLVTSHVKLVVGAKVHIIAKSSPKSIAVPNVMGDGVLGPNPESVVIYSVLGDAPVPSNPIVS